MNWKKAFKEHFGSPYFKRMAKYFLPFYKGPSYFKILTGDVHVGFAYGCYFFPKTLPPHFHEELEFLYVRHGRGTYYLAGKIYPLHKRLLLITKPNEIHVMMKVPLHEKEECGSFIFPLDWLGMDLDITSWPHEVLLSEDEAARFDMICWQVSEEVANRRSGYEDMIRAKYQEICCLVGRIVSQPKKERTNTLVDQLREYINQHFTEEISILNISKAFGYTEQYLNRVFKKATRLSLKRYILSRRVMEARMLLEAKPELKLVAIAGQVGFENYTLFHRIFKILTGVKPQAYRHVIKSAVAMKDGAR